MSRGESGLFLSHFGFFLFTCQESTGAWWHWCKEIGWPLSPGRGAEFGPTATPLAGLPSQRDEQQAAGRPRRAHVDSAEK